MGAGLKAHNVFKKKYPLIISDERVSLSHLNLMTLFARETFFTAASLKPAFLRISVSQIPAAGSGYRILCMKSLLRPPPNKEQ